MILVDANVLLYATNEAASQHKRARDWLDTQLGGSSRVGLPWPALLAFLRIATNRRVYPNAMTMPDARRQISEWLACNPVWIPNPTERHAEVLDRLLSLPGLYGNLVTDAHLAALAIEHGLTLCSTDGDFARFPDLRWTDPIAD